MTARDPLPPIAILAGGRATRLFPISQDTPKSMVDVAGEPFIAHQLRLVAAKGARSIVVCHGVLGEQIEDFVGSGAAFGLSVRYSHDGDSLLGTGGALHKALPLLGPEFMVLYGDSYLDTDYAAVVAAFHSCSDLGLMTVYRNEGRWDRSNIEFLDSRIVAYDKGAPTPAMHYIDYGLSVLRADALTSWPANDVFDLADVFRRLIEARALAGYEVRERFYEIGSHAGLDGLSRTLGKRNPSR